MDRAERKSVAELLNMELSIPNYQRPYKWAKKNVEDLLTDILSAIEQDKKQAYQPDGECFKYRIGTVILHWNEDDGVYDVVDGQQRIISLMLIRRFITDEKDRRFVLVNLKNPITQANLCNNYVFIQDWFTLRTDKKEEVLQAFSSLLEVVMIVVQETSEAFQLFDSQNSRGKELDPHDLLKAYHLREMKGHRFDMQRAVTKWEAVSPSEIKELFGKYLFPIIKWSDREKSTAFTAQEIDVFKGIEDKYEYAYAVRARKAMPTFQLTEAFTAGNDFFSMVDHYLALLDYLRETIADNFPEIDGIIGEKSDMPKSVGFDYAKTLFECAVLCYYDRFRNLDEQAVKKLFTWAFMLRVDMENLGFDSINRYAVGVYNSVYTNIYPMFSMIEHARLHTEISNLTIKVKREPDEARTPKWQTLYERLKAMNHVDKSAGLGGKV